MKAICKGDHFKEATLTVCKAGGATPLPYIVIKMKDVYITNLSVGASMGANSGEKLKENVTLTFSSFEYTYQKQAANGAADGAAKPFNFDIKANH